MYTKTIIILKYKDGNNIIDLNKIELHNLDILKSVEYWINWVKTNNLIILDLPYKIY